MEFPAKNHSSWAGAAVLRARRRQPEGQNWDLAVIGPMGAEPAGSRRSRHCDAGALRRQKCCRLFKRVIGLWRTACIHLIAVEQPIRFTELYGYVLRLKMCGHRHALIVEDL